VYTVRFEAAVFVLHVFQKKSKSGVATPKPDMELIETRLKRAAEIAIDWTAQFRALAKIGYSDTVNLETHSKGGGTPEECTRISWAGMKTDRDHAKMG
jgi:hypothetical protein